MVLLRYPVLFIVLLGFTSSSVDGFAYTSNSRTTPFLALSRNDVLSYRPVTTILRNSETGDETNEPNEAKDDAEKAKSDNSSASNDILNSPPFLKRKLEVLRTDVLKADADIEAAKERLEAGKAEWGAQIEDLEKEYKNIQQRMSAQSSKSDDQAVMQVSRQMLDVLDNFDRAFGQVTAETESDEAIVNEYRKAYDTILATFKNLGVEEIQSVGTEFNYEVHQAVMQKPSDEYEEGIVCEEFQKGYKIGDTLIRASMVAVAA